MSWISGYTCSKGMFCFLTIFFILALIWPLHLTIPKAEIFFQNVMKFGTCVDRWAIMFNFSGWLKFGPLLDPYPLILLLNYLKIHFPSALTSSHQNPLDQWSWNFTCLVHQWWNQCLRDSNPMLNVAAILKRLFMGITNCCYKWHATLIILKAGTSFGHSATIFFFFHMDQLLDVKMILPRHWCLINRSYKISVLALSL